MKTFTPLLLTLAFILLTATVFSQTKYAVLITGDYATKDSDVPLENQWNEGEGKGTKGYDEFWNDTFLMWELLQKKGFAQDNIFVLFADGIDFYFVDHTIGHRYRPDSSNTIVTDFSATCKNIFKVFNGLHFGLNGFPQITSDDFLFVWTFDHGKNDDNGNVYLQLLDGDMIDTTFAALVNPIPANKKVFWMQQCNSGGFADDLQAENVVFHSASQAHQSAHRADDYPCQENEGIDGTIYHHGEFNFHVFSAVNCKTPDGDTLYCTEPLRSADINNDGVISIFESWVWERDHESTRETPLYCDTSNIGTETSLAYPTLLHTDVSASRTVRGEIGISRSIHVLTGQTLTFAANSKIDLLNITLTVDNGATLIIANGVKVNGIKEKSIIVNGTIDIGENVVFTNTNLSVHSTTFEVSKCQFIETELNANCGAESISSTVSILNCKFENIEKNGITITNYGNYIIENNTISAANGIQIINSGLGFCNQQRIRNNEIRNCSDVGVIFYNATATLQNNYIHNNQYGVKLLNTCNVEISGTPSASVSFHTQRIKNNQNFQVYSSKNAFPWDFKFNVISVDNQTHTTPYLYYGDDEMGIASTNLKDVTYNCWGANFNPATHLFPPNQYYYLPTWCPSGITDTIGGNDEDLFDLAILAFETGKYANAKALFAQIIDDFPTSYFAQVAMQELFRVESFVNSNYYDLQNYYLNNSNIQTDTTLANLADILVNQCNIKLQNYADAIAWYENKILNPTSLEDSVFAIIDLGYLYLLMENNNAKNSYTGSLAMYKPKTETQYKAHRKKLWDLLPAQKTEKNKSHFTNTPIAKLYQNVPNPANNSTLIKYELFQNATVAIQIKDNLGKTIAQLEQGNREKGVWEAQISTNALKSGIYFYSLFVDGQSVEVKKMVIVK